MQQLGRYEIIAELGRGAMGTVYRARDPKIDRVVAIKTIIAAIGNPEQEREFRGRFFREAQAAGKLSHPGIVTIFDVGEDEPTHTPIIVMEYISGRTLESWLTDAGGKRPALQTAVDWVRQVAEALEYAHSQGIVHRDIKPANIIITPDGRAKITDFGVAKLTQSEFTVPGQILGTPAYMSPEQLSGGAIDGRSDLFSLGAILYWVLAGEKPFTGDTATVLYQVVCQDPAPVSERNAALAPDFDRVVRRALAKDPAARYQRGRDLADDLKDLLSGQPPRLAQAEAVVEKTVIETSAARVKRAVVTQRLSPGSGPLVAPVFGAGALRPVARFLLQRGVEPLGHFLSRLSPKMRVAVGGSTVLVLSLALLLGAGSRPVTILGPTPTVSVQVRARHSFSSANLSIWADDKLVYQGRLTGVVRKKFFRTWVEGSFSETVPVPAGKRLVKVRVASPGAGYDEVAQIQADLQPASAPTLIISFGPAGELRLARQP